MDSLRVAGHRIEVHEEGTGPAVVVVHSSGMSARQWKLLRVDLAPSFRVLAPDLIGYGESEPWLAPGPFDLRDDEAVVVEVARRADDGRGVRLVGHSYGALLCLRAAARGGLDVRTVAVYEPVAFGVLQDHAEDEQARIDLAQLGDEDFVPALDGTEEWLRRFVGYWQGPGGWDAMNAPARERFSAAAHKTFHEVNGLRLDRTPSAIYRDVRAPVLLLQGGETTPAERRTCQRLAELLPEVTHEVVPGAGHLGPLTHAREVNRRIADHLARIG